MVMETRKGSIMIDNKPIFHRFYRTVIRVTSISDGILTAIIPSWNLYEKILIAESDMPSEIVSEIRSRIDHEGLIWLFAKVNIGVINSQDIRFIDFEKPVNEEGLDLIFP